jgi:hypothetical protein
MMWKLLALAACAALLCSAAPSFADSITLSDPTVTPNLAGSFIWSYTVSIDQFEHINTVTQNSAFVTLYDVSGLVPGTAKYVSNAGAPAGFPTVQDTGLTPSTQNPVDNPAIPNITVDFSGMSASSQTLGTLSFVDTQSGVANSNFSAQATNNDNTVDANTSSVPVPAPEPGTLALMLSGAIGLAAFARRRFLG